MNHRRNGLRKLITEARGEPLELSRWREARKTHLREGGREGDGVLQKESHLAFKDGDFRGDPRGGYVLPF